MNKELEAQWREEEVHVWDMGKFEQKLTEQGINTARPVHRMAYLAACKKRNEEIKELKMSLSQQGAWLEDRNAQLHFKDEEIKELKEKFNELEAAMNIALKTLVMRDREIEELVLDKNHLLKLSQINREYIQKRDELLEQASKIYEGISTVYEYRNKWLNDYEGLK